jgi:D-arabinose 1-dehydrogenase-like Zn-dependent alcohol dehydrogenase
MLSYDVVQWGKSLESAERKTPVPTGTEVLLRLKYCGVCHSDVHIRDGYFELGGGKRLSMTERGINLPATLGHEPYGTVVAAGPEAVNVPIGEDRLVYPWTGCGACARCREGLDNFCMVARCIGLQRPGGYADHLLVPHPRYLVDAAGIDPAWAATLSCSGLTTYSAVSKLGPIPQEEWVAVVGAGGLGLSAVSMLRALGHERIVMVDVDNTRLQAAENFGAAAAVNSREADSAAKLKKICDGSLFGAVDLVGTGETASFSLGLLRKGGRLVLVGLFGGEIPVSIVSTIMRAITIQGSHLGSLAELEAVVALAQKGKLHPIPIRKQPLASVSLALDELKAGAVVGRIVVEM